MGLRGPKRNPNSRRGRREARKAALAAISSTAPAALPESAIDAHVAPAHLSHAMRGLWHQVVKEHRLKSDQVATLLLGCEAWDRKEGARALIAEHGLILADRRNPAVDVELQSQAIFLRAMRQLRLNAKPDGLADLF